MANLLNSDKRVLYFYGLGLGLSTNGASHQCQYNSTDSHCLNKFRHCCAAYNPNQFKFELMLLAEYEESFSTYTFKQFLEDYTVTKSSVQDEHQRMVIGKLQSNFSITSVKVLLVSLLNAFRDLTLMGVQVRFSCCGPKNYLLTHT